MELVTGRAGSPHITAQQDRQKHQGIWGDGAYILATGNQLEPEVQSSNKILIKDGALMFQGALFSVKVGTTDEITINNGNQGMQRKDLVVARYTYDSAQNIESAEWVVIQGTPAASNPVAPSGTSGDIQAGDATVDCPFMIVNLDGINVTGVDIIPEVIDTLPELIGNLFYEPGDTVSITSLIAFGYLTTSRTQMWVDIPVAKRLDNVSSAEVIAASCLIRQNGNYLINSDGTVFNFTPSRAELMLLKGPGTVRLVYTFSNAITGTNNDVLSVQFYDGAIRLS